MSALLLILPNGREHRTSGEVPAIHPGSVCKVTTAVGTYAVREVQAGTPPRVYLRELTEKEET